MVEKKRSKSRSKRKSKRKSRIGDWFMGWKPLHWEAVLNGSVPPHPTKYAKYDKWERELTPVAKYLYNTPLWKGLILYIPKEKVLSISFWPDEYWRDEVTDGLGELKFGNFAYFTVNRPYKFAPNTGWMIRDH